MRVTSPRIGSADASQKTLRNRTEEVSSYRRMISGDCATEQMMDELKVLDPSERKQLVESGVFSTSAVVSAKNTLAFKADLQIPWNKLRAMRRYVHSFSWNDKHKLICKRWMKSWGIQIASESRVRRMSEELVGDNIDGEEAPFCFPGTTGVDIRPAPLVYVPDLIMKITQLLDQNEK